MTDIAAPPAPVTADPAPPVDGPPPSDPSLPPGAPPPAPVGPLGVLGQPGPAATGMLSPQEVEEIDIRDHLGLKLGTTALTLCSQVAELSPGDPSQCKDMAQAVLYLTEALVLVAPLESTGQTAGPGGGPVPLPPKHLPPQASLNTAEQQATGRPA